MKDLKTKKLYKAIKKQMRKHLNKYFEENTMLYKSPGVEPYVDFYCEEYNATYFELLKADKLIEKTYKKFKKKNK